MDNQPNDPINKAAEAVDKAGEASRKSFDEAGRVASQTARHAAKANEHIAHRAADVGLRGAGIMKATIETGIETAVHGFERVTEHFTTALGVAGPEAEKLAAKSRENLDAISQAQSALIKGAEDISHQWMTLAKDAFAKNFDAMTRLRDCRSIQDVLATQSELWRDNMSQAIEGTRRVAEIYSKTSEEAANRVRLQKAA